MFRAGPLASKPHLRAYPPIIPTPRKIGRIHLEPTGLEVEGLEMTIHLVVAVSNKAIKTAGQAVGTATTEAAGGLRISGITA